jgi:hypothetical protein
MLRSFALQAEIERLASRAELVEFFRTTGEHALGEAALSLLPSYTIGNGRVQTFFERLVGVRMRDEHAQVMAALRAHVERRNRIAHRGEQVSREDARASLAAVLAVCQLVHELSYRALGLDHVLEEEARREREMFGDEDQAGWR